MVDDDAPALLVSQAEYARHRGVGRSAIADLVKRGKIALIEKDGRKWVDAAAADRALGETRERISLRAEPAAPTMAPDVAAAMPSAGDGAKLTKAKTATEVYRARLAQLEYEEKTGKLIPAAAAAKEWARTLSKLIAETETFLHSTLARDTAERFGLDWKAVSVTFREAYRKHRAAAAEEAHAELGRRAEVEPLE